MTLQIHSLTQGTEDWHKFRSEHYGASEAAAMLGLSSYVTRSQLLHQKATGISPEVSPALQAVFDRGHETERLAIPLIEKIIGEALSPITCSVGNLSCSCDGLTFDGTISVEHKQYNETLFRNVLRGNLPEEHMPQCQQNLMVTCAEKLIFVVSDGTPEHLAYMEILPDTAWFERIRAGWEFFDKEVQSYIPPEVIPAAVAAPQMALPSVSIQVQGSIALIDNLGAFGDALTAYVERINKKPETDNDFATLEATVKTLKSAEEALDAAENGALAQTNSIDTMRRTVALYRDMARSNRLLIDKLVSQRKDQIKGELISQANDAYRQHIESLEAEIVPIRLNVMKPDFAIAAKNKRTITSLRDSLDTALAQSKIETDAVAKSIRSKLTWFREFSAYEFLFRDMQQVIQKPMEDMQLTVTARINAHKAAEEAKLDAERVRIQIEEEMKARAKIEAEQAKPCPSLDITAPAMATEPAKTIQSVSEQKPTHDTRYTVKDPARIREAAPHLLAALLAVRELVPSGSEAMAIIDEACAQAGVEPWKFAA